MLQFWKSKVVKYRYVTECYVQVKPNDKPKAHFMHNYVKFSAGSECVLFPLY